MSNRTTNSAAELASGHFIDEHSCSIERGALTQPACVKCGAQNLSEAAPQRFDDLKALFMDKKTANGPYRCLDCDHRFWLDETFSVGNKRTWTLLFIALMFALLLLNYLGVFSRSGAIGQIGVIVPDVTLTEDSAAGPDQESLSDDSGPSLASLIAMPQSDVNPRDRVRAEKAYVSYEAPLTPEQEALRLSYAKQEAAQAERLSRARIAQLDRVLAPADNELASLARIEVGHVLERWREAWSKGDADGYLVNYSDGFTPSNDLSIDAWKASRRARVRPEKNISVELSNFDITMIEQGNAGVVEFNQRYKSGAYVERSRKRMSVVREQGVWKITAEVELN